MNTQTEALKMAIEALEIVIVAYDQDKQFINALKVCKEALESQEQEPVKQRVKVLYEKDGIQTCEILHDTHPAQPLSENVVGELIEDYHFGTMTIGDFVRHVEKAHGIV